MTGKGPPRGLCPSPRTQRHGPLLEPICFQQQQQMAVWEQGRVSELQSQDPWASESKEEPPEWGGRGWRLPREETDPTSSLVTVSLRDAPVWRTAGKFSDGGVGSAYRRLPRHPGLGNRRTPAVSDACGGETHTQPKADTLGSL